MRFLIPLTVILIGFGSLAPELSAQRQYQYEELRQRDFTPRGYMSIFGGISDAQGDANATAVFKLRSDRLQFRSVSASNREHPDERFASQIRINFEVFRVDEEGERTGSPVVRDSYQKRASATSYDQTQSKSRFVEASYSFNVAPGDYVMRAIVYSNNQEQGTFNRPFEVKEQSDDYDWVILTKHQNEEGAYRFINKGNNSNFGQSLTAIASLPEYSENYRVEVDRKRVRGEDTTLLKQVYDEPLRSENIHQNQSGVVTSREHAPYLELNPDGELILAEINLPNESFTNNHHTLRIIKEEDGQQEVVTEYTWYNLWIDMPVALLNVDFAIRKLRHIADDSEVNSMRRGSRIEREEQLIEFWKEQDPDADTSPNSKMAEFYRRIDEAYDRFTTPSGPGYESDQGKIFITMGEPIEKNRRFPSNAPTREIWEYENATYIFEATSGFGDYVLVDQQ